MSQLPSSSTTAPRNSRRNSRRHRLTPLQMTFFKACVQEPAALSILMKRTGLSPFVLQRWLGEPRFQRALSRLLRRSAERRDVSLALAAVHAADRLAEATDDSGDKSPKSASLAAATRQACVDVVKLARQRSVRVITSDEPPTQESLLAPEALPDLEQLIDTLDESND